MARMAEIGTEKGGKREKEAKSAHIQIGICLSATYNMQLGTVHAYGLVQCAGSGAIDEKPKDWSLAPMISHARICIYCCRGEVRMVSHIIPIILTLTVAIFKIPKMSRMTRFKACVCECAGGKM